VKGEEEITSQMVVEEERRKSLFSWGGDNSIDSNGEAVDRGAKRISISSNDHFDDRTEKDKGDRLGRKGRKRLRDFC